MDIDKLKDQHAMMKAALVRIASYSDPDEIEEDDEGFTEWGCGRDDAIEMAYENVITEAQLALGKLTD